MKYAKSLIIAAVLVLAMGFSRPPKIQPIAAGSSGSGTASVYAANGSDNYIVRPGETLSMIASQNGTTASALEQANSILASTNNTVQTGERLNVPNANEGPTAVLVQGSGSSASSSSSSSSSGSSQATLVIGGFPANTALQIGVGMETGPISNVMNATTDANGQVTQQVSMPSGMSSQMSANWVAVVLTMNSSSSSSSSSGSGSSSSSSSSSSNSSGASANSGQILVVSNALSTGSSSQSSSSSGSSSSSSSTGSSSSSTGAPASSSSGSSNGSSSGSSGSSSSTGSSSSNGSSSSSSTGAPASSSSGSSSSSSSNPSGSSSGSSSSSSSSSSGSATIPSTGKASPAVKLTPTQGGPGTRVLLQASGFPADTLVNVELGAKGSSTPANLATDQTDANGNLTAYVTIPNRAQGSQQASWVVTVATAAGTAVSATSGAFTVPAAPQASSSSSSGSATIPSTGKASPAVQLTPTQGGPGTRVLLQASGFPANTPVNVELGAQGSSTPANLATDLTDANGNLTAYVTIPNRAQGSQQASWVVTVATTTGTAVSATSSAFTVPAAPQASSSSSSSSATIPSTGKASPTVKLTPTQGGPGTRVLVQASGFPANTLVNVELGPQGSSTPANLATDQTDASGNLTVYVTIPNRAQGSQQASWVVMVTTAAGTSVSATSGAFTVPAAP